MQNKTHLWLFQFGFSSWLSILVSGTAIHSGVQARKLGILNSLLTLVHQSFLINHQTPLIPGPNLSGPHSLFSIFCHCLAKPTNLTWAPAADSGWAFHLQSHPQFSLHCSQNPVSKAPTISPLNPFLDLPFFLEESLRSLWSFPSCLWLLLQCLLFPFLPHIPHSSYTEHLLLPQTHTVSLALRSLHLPRLCWQGQDWRLLKYK